MVLDQKWVWLKTNLCIVHDLQNVSTAPETVAVWRPRHILEHPSSFLHMRKNLPLTVVDPVPFPTGRRTRGVLCHSNAVKLQRLLAFRTVYR